MNSEPLPKGRAKIITDSLGLKVVIPSKKKVFTIFFVPIWLGFWVFGEIMVFTSLFTQDHEIGQRIVMTVWLVFWQLGGIWAAYTLLWTLFGRETFVIDGQKLTVMRTIFGLGQKKNYDLSHIKRMRVLEESSETSWFGGQMQVWGMHSGMIGFDYGAKTFRIARAVDAAEAHQIIELMASRFHIDRA